MSKVIITCAVTGSIHTPTMSPHLPITPDEIAADGVAAAEAGASILHLYARDPADGRPASPTTPVHHNFCGVSSLHRRAAVVRRLQINKNARAFRGYHHS